MLGVLAAKREDSRTPAGRSDFFWIATGDEDALRLFARIRDLVRRVCRGEMVARQGGSSVKGAWDIGAASWNLDFQRTWTYLAGGSGRVYSRAGTTGARVGQLPASYWRVLLEFYPQGRWNFALAGSRGMH